MNTSRLGSQRFVKRLVVQVRSFGTDNVPVPVDLGYDSSDPYAVTVCFQTGEAPVVWTFARDLLVDGLGEPTGDGDVHVWPSLDDEGHAVVNLELTAPSGDALAELRIDDLADFVDRMHRLVPVGAESGHLDLDAVISALLPTESV